MDEVQLKKSIDHLLEYCRKQSTMGPRQGSELGPLLLGRKIESLGDAWELYEAMKALLVGRLAHYRTINGLTLPVTDSSIEHGEALAADLAAEKTDLKIWSVLWAYYICEMSHEDIGLIGDWSKRTNQDILRDGRENYVAKEIAKLEQQLKPSTVETEGGRQQASAPLMPQPSSPGNGKQAGTDITNLLFAFAMLLIVLITWLLSTWSWPSIGVLLVAALWRTASHSQTLKQHWSLEDDQHREDTWWHVGYMLSWFGLVTWTIVVAAQNHAVATTATFLIDRIALLLAFFCISATIFMLSLFDLLLWVSRANGLQWPWKLLEPYARGCWQTRWYMVAIGWALLFASLMPQLLPAFYSLSDNVLDSAALW